MMGGTERRQIRWKVVYAIEVVDSQLNFYLQSVSAVRVSFCID